MRKETLSWLVDPFVRWRHPTARIGSAVAIMVLDFYMYAEDPVNDSHVEYSFPGIGHVYGLFCLWPREVPLGVLRAALILVSLCLGIYVGRQWLHHRLLRDRLGLAMFEGSKGTWFVMTVPVLSSLYLGALAYNRLIPRGAAPIEARTFVKVRNVAKAFQCLSVLLDIISIAQIVDAVLQDRHKYPQWAARFKDVWTKWCRGWVRVLVMWVLVIVSVALSFVSILRRGHDAQSYRWDTEGLGGLTEVTRTLFVNLIIFCDLTSVAQDWEFPAFREPLDVMIAGTFVEELSCDFPARLLRRCCKGLPPNFAEFFRFSVTGPWLTYGPLFAVLGADLGCANTQFSYRPEDYGQYVDPGTGRIWNIVDDAYLRRAYDAGRLVRPELVRWEARRDLRTGAPLDASAATDIQLRARYLYSTLEHVGIVPGILFIAAFAILVYSAERAESAMWRSRAMELVGAAVVAFFSLSSWSVVDTQASVRMPPGVLQEPEVR